MTDYMIARIIDIAYYIKSSNKTIREAAKHFGVSKSTVSKDCNERLCYLNKSLFRQVNEILQQHWDERGIRGGMATKQKSLLRRNKDANNKII